MRMPPMEPERSVPYEPVPADLLAWARQTFDVHEFMEGVREIEATGGISLDAVLEEIAAQAPHA